MVSKKQEKLHNSPSVKGILIMPKSEIHPKWYPDAKVICNGEVVMTTGSTQPELHVDVWSGNHPVQCFQLFKYKIKFLLRK